MSDAVASISYRTDTLDLLNRPANLNRKLGAVHAALRQQMPSVHRAAVAVFEERTQLLKTFLASQASANTLVQYETTLDNAPSLQEIVRRRSPRVVNDLTVFEQGTRRHTRLIRELGFRSSYTVPLFTQGQLFGFVFLNSHEPRCFTEGSLPLLDVYAHLMGQLVLGEVRAIQTLLAAFRTLNQLVRFKDPETGNHLERMSRYARLIARHLANSGAETLDDEYIEYLFAFSPLHDVGKLSIPDRVLLKPARLTGEEWEVMKTHALRGREIIDTIIVNFGLQAFEHLDLLERIAEQHHETLDGRGYPHGRRGDEVSLEARIVAVADVFDALTSRRPYKEAWSNARAFELLRMQARDKLDGRCVEALIAHETEIADIRATFPDDDLA